jgi:hypothetical protein
MDYVILNKVLAGGKVGDVSDHRIRKAFPWHDLKADGLWLSTDHTHQLHSAKLIAQIEWHPQRDHHKPALPLPFTVYDFAAFLLHGGGDQFLAIELGGLPLCEENLGELGPNSSVEVHLLRTSCELIALAANRFSSPDEGVNEDAIAEAAKWLLSMNQAMEVGVTPKPSEVTPGSDAVSKPIPQIEKPDERDDRRYAELKAAGGDYVEVAGGRWNVTGPRGLIAGLARTEKSANRPMSDEKNIRESLKKAVKRARAGRRGNFAFNP